MLVTVPSTLCTCPPCASTTPGTDTTSATTATANQFFMRALLVTTVGRRRRGGAAQERLFLDLLPDLLGRPRQQCLHCRPLGLRQLGKMTDGVHQLPRRRLPLGRARRPCR